MIINFKDFNILNSVTKFLFVIINYAMVKMGIRIHHLITFVNTGASPFATVT